MGYQPTLPQDVLPNVPEVFGVGSGSLQTTNEVSGNTFTESENDLQYSVKNQIPLVENVPENQPTIPFNVVPAVPTEPSPQITNSPVVTPLPTPVLYAGTPSQVQEQSIPTQSPISIPQEHIEPQYSAGKQFSAFNPFQSPQYQTGQATSLHQQRPQYQSTNPYIYSSYPSYHYPVWSGNPYFQNMFYFG